MRDPDAPGPNRPADAAFVLLGLLPSWTLTSAPPSLGVELVVSGRDYRPTIWRLPENTAIRVARLLRRDRRIRTVRARYYVEKENA